MIRVLLISLDLEEIFKLSDRILVIYNGKIVANLDPKTTRQEVGLYMSEETSMVNNKSKAFCT